MDLAARLLETFDSPEYRPPTLPAVGLELIQLTYKPEVEFSDLLRVLERDPLLAGRVLQIAQSPLYGGRVAVGSLERALVRIGIATLREIVWEVVLGLRLFRVKGYTEPMERVRRHSTATAYVTRLLGRYSRYQDELSFLAGLLHDCGLAGALIVLAEDPDRPSLEEHWPALHQAHEHAGSQMVRLWGLSAELEAVVGSHHSAPLSPAEPKLWATTVLADALASELGAGVVPPAAPHASVVDVSMPAALEIARKTLGLDDATLALIRGEAADVLAAVK